MAQVYRSNIASVAAALNRIAPRIEARVTRVVARATAYINDTIHTRVPVWSGRAVRNMIWTMNSPNTREIEPIAAGDYGEGRRGANTAAAQATYNALTFSRPYGIYILSNNARHIGLIEDGAAPTPERARFPAGAFRVTVADVLRLLNSGAL